MSLAAALLTIFPHLAPYLSASPLGARVVYVARANVIESAARLQGVPVEVVGAVCWSETRLGVWRAYASLCGVRLDHRYVADDDRSAEIAARTLGRLHARCGTWPRALARYRTGGPCGDPRGMGYALATVGTAERLRMQLDDGAESGPGGAL